MYRDFATINNRYFSERESLRFFVKCINKWWNRWAEFKEKHQLVIYLLHKTCALTQRNIIVLEILVCIRNIDYRIVGELQIIYWTLRFVATSITRFEVRISRGWQHGVRQTWFAYNSDKKPGQWFIKMCIYRYATREPLFLRLLFQTEWTNLIAMQQIAKRMLQDSLCLHGTVD